MADWKRYVNRTEAWAREVTDDVEDIVGSTGRTTAYQGDMIVNQSLRGQSFTYVLTRDDFDNNWHTPDDVDTDTTESDTGDAGELQSVAPAPEESTTEDNYVDDYTAEENPVHEPVFGQTATVGTRDNPTPADAPDTGGDAVPESPDTTTDDAPPSPTASAPTGAGSGDAETPAGTPPTVPDPAGNATAAMSPVSGTETPPGPAEAPVGSAASDATAEPAATVETATETAEPATTTPTQTVDPSSDPGGAGTATADDTGGVTSTTNTGGGDEGAAPTPTDLPAAAAEPTADAADNPTADDTSADTPPDAVETVTPKNSRAKAKDLPQA